MQAAHMLDQLIEPSSVNLLQNQKDKQLNQHRQYSLQTFQLMDKSKTATKYASHSSYKAVLQQSLTTQDKPLIYEILSQGSQQLIKNTLQQINVSKVSALLKNIEQFLGQHKNKTDNTKQMMKWLEWLLKIHLSIIVSNMQNKQTIERIRKLINKRTCQREALIKIKNQLYNGETQKSQMKKVYNPKFDYVQQQKVEQQNFQHQQQKNQMEEQGMDLNEQIDDFFDQEEF